MMQSICCKKSRFALLICTSALFCLASELVSAQVYPDRPIKLVVGYSAGGSTDIVARVFAQSMAKQLGQPIVVVNQPGANSNIGSEYVAHSKPDGYTLLVGTISSTINKSLYRNLGYDFQKDFQPIGLFAKVPNVLVVNPREPINSVKDYLTYAKANPGRLTCASAGTGSSIHLSCELFKMETDTNILHVPYKGSGPAVTDLLGGQVASMFDNLPSSMAQIRSGKLRALALTTSERIALMPDLPTIAASGLPGFDVSSWFGLVAPKGVPAQVVAILNKAVNVALESESVRETLNSGGYLISSSANTPESFKKMIDSETDKWARVINKINLKID